MTNIPYETEYAQDLMKGYGSFMDRSRGVNPEVYRTQYEKEQAEKQKTRA